MLDSHEKLPQISAHFDQNRANLQREYFPSMKSQDAKSLHKSSSISSASSSNSSSASSTGSSYTTANTDRITLLSTGKFEDKSAGTRQDLDDFVLYNLPPVVTNSSLVRQRAKDSLAVAAVTTGASLPLMIGGRSKCVVNFVEIDSSAKPTAAAGASLQVAAAAQATNQRIPTSPLPSGPQNTALRAEQRNRQRQNMVSVVRPVVNRSPLSPDLTLTEPRLNRRLEDSAFWAEQVNAAKLVSSVSLIDDLMSLDRRISSHPNSNSSSILDDLLIGGPNNSQLLIHQHPSEQQMRQQMALYRREQHELNRNVRRQHSFIVAKIEERKRNLQIVQSVWVHKDFKHAIEKLVDIYHQGLVFTPTDPYGKHHETDKRFTSMQSSSSSSASNTSNKSHVQESQKTKLSSLNSSLVVDVISVIILRPKLWNLEICQLLLPIIINDLLVQKATPYEYYIEIAIKSLRLILTHFSPVIKSTLESQKDSNRLLVGVDLSREDRINKCLNCYKLLMEARALIARRLASSGNVNSSNPSSINGKLAAICRELEQCFA